MVPRGRALRELGCQGSLGAPLWSCGNPGRQRCSISEGDGRHTWGPEGEVWCEGGPAGGDVGWTLSHCVTSGSPNYPSRPQVSLVEKGLAAVS